MFITKKLKKELQKDIAELTIMQKLIKDKIKNIETELLIQKNEILKLKNQKPKEEKDFEAIFKNNKPKLTMQEMINSHLKCKKCKNYGIDQSTNKWSCIYANKKDCQFEKIEEK